MSSEDGSMAAKRLAHVGTDGFYLTYASRWFPLHDSDLATSDVTLIVPAGLQVSGSSDEPVVAQRSPKEGATRYHFVQRKPARRFIVVFNSELPARLKFQFALPAI